MNLLFSTQSFVPEDREALARFYAIGHRVRKRCSGKAFKWWKEEENILKLHTFHPEWQWQLWCTSKGRYEGRLGAVIHPDGKAYLGWYECDDHPALSRHLFGLALAWLSNRGCQTVTGPVNGSTWYAYRWNVHASEPAFGGEPFQPAHYVKQWELAGFSEAESYISTVNDVSDLPTVSYEKTTNQLQRSQLKPVPLTAELNQKHLPEIHSFLLECFASNPHFSSIGLEEFQWAHRHFESVLDERFSFLVFDEKEQPVGLIIARADYLLLEQKPPVIIKTLAVTPFWRRRQVGTLLAQLVHSLAGSLGYSKVIHALMYRKNVSAGMSDKQYQFTAFRHYQLYRKKL